MKEFLQFRLDPLNKCLWHSSGAEGDKRILLAPTAFALLEFLVDHADDLVTQTQLLHAVWGKTHVQPQAVKRHVLDVRVALGDDPKAPRFIETLPRRGYRFIAPVRESGSEAQGRVPGIEAGKLVGRDGVLDELRRHLQAALLGERQIVFVTGEPGIGKTTVIDEFERLAAKRLSIQIARGQCVEGYGGKEAYYPMLEALGRLCRRPQSSSIVQTLATQAPTWLVQFPALVTADQRETLQREILGATRERMLREIGEALETITAQDPIVLIFEDLQWTDQSTVDLISALARGRGAAKLVLLGTYRPTDVLLSEHPLKFVKEDLLLHGLCHEISLEPLNQVQVTEYLATRAGETRALEGLAGLIHRHSEGNPLFMVAALEHMSKKGFISQENGSWQIKTPLEEIDLEVPENLRQMIETQAERLTKDEQRVLEVASAVGSTFSSFVAAPAAGMERETFGGICASLSRRELMIRAAGTRLFPDDSVSDCYEFVHALYRGVFYSRPASETRAQSHQTIGEQLERLFVQHSQEIAAELAHHFEASRDWPRAITYLRMVADNLGRRYAHREAVSTLHHALDLTGKLPDGERTRVEIDLLIKLAEIYLVSFDMRVVETCETLVARAVDHGLVDVEIRALIDMAFPVSWSSAENCVCAVNRALELSSRQKDPLQRARTRASCLVRRIWAGGWDATDAEECRKAVAEIRLKGDRLVLASHLIDCNFVQWASSEYREAQRNNIESLGVLQSSGREGNPYLSTAHWMSEFILPWSLLFLGEWGEMLRQLRRDIAMAEKNEDTYRAQIQRIYEAWLYFHAMDYAAVVGICETILPHLSDSMRTPWRRFCRTLLGCAQTALGAYASARQSFSIVSAEISVQKVIHDWYCRLMLESGLAELFLANGDLIQARFHAERLLEEANATAERTWQALAWEINARVASAGTNREKARDCITNALLRIDGWEAPLAAWRIHATGAEISEELGDSGLADHHRELSRAIILKLAGSLPAEEPMRHTFLSAQPVCKIFESPALRGA